MDKLGSFKIPTKRKIVEEVQLEDDLVEESSSTSTPDLPASEKWEIVDANEEERQEIQEILTTSPKKVSGNTPSAEECWKQMTVHKVQMIRNRRLKRSYDGYKRKYKILNDGTAYRVVYDTEEIRRIAKKGLSVNQDSLLDIGDSSLGVVLFNSPAMAYSGRYLYANIPIHVMMFRTATAGKRSEVTWGGQCLPSKNHTSHALMKTDGIKSKFHRYLLDHYEAAVYYYEYIANKTDVLKCPSMILPYAVITFTLPETAFPAHSPPKLSKINKSFMYFGDYEICKHTIVFREEEIPATVCLPLYLKDAPYFLHETTSTPEVCSLSKLGSFPELEMLRGPDCFGKMLSTDSVILPDSNLVTYYTLRFEIEHKNFVDFFREKKCMLVWKSFPFIVFYLPSGEISAEFGLPHKDNYMHLIVLRLNLGGPEMRTMSTISYSTVLLDYGMLWNKPVEYAAEAIESDDIDDQVYEDDYGDAAMEAREDEEEEKRKKGSILRQPGAVSNNRKLRWKDEANPGDIPGSLVETRYFDKDEASTPQHVDDHRLSFNEMQKKERENEKVQLDEDRERTENEKMDRDMGESDETSQDGMASGSSRESSTSPFYDPASVPYSPESSNLNSSTPSPTPYNAPSPAGESPGNTNTASPSSLNAPSPDQPDFIKNVPGTFNVPPPNVPIAPPTTAIEPLPVPFPTNLSIPPPPIRRLIAPSRFGTPLDFSVPPPAPPHLVSPTLMSVPPPTISSKHRRTPPPPGTNATPSNHLPAPSLLIPAALSSPTVRPSCLVPDSGPPRDPRSSMDYVKDAASTSRGTISTEEEPGEEPMDVEDADSSGIEVINEDDNDLLKWCFTAGALPTASAVPAPEAVIPLAVAAAVVHAPESVTSPTVSAPEAKPVAADNAIDPDLLVQKTLANMIRGSGEIMGLITRKKLESESATSSSSEPALASGNGTTDSVPARQSVSQDTDLRIRPGSHVNFTINKAKPKSVFSLPNAFREDSDSDEDMDKIPLPPGKAPTVPPSSSSQDIDYRKLQHQTSQSTIFPQDRDDRPGSLTPKIQSMFTSGTGKSENVQDKQSVLHQHIPHPKQESRVAPPPAPPKPSPLPGVGGLFPNLLSACRSSLGLRGILSMRTSTSASDVSASPSTSIATTSSQSSHTGMFPHSSNGNGNVSTTSLTRKLNEIMNPTQITETSTSNGNGELRNNGVHISDSDVMIIDEPAPSNSNPLRPNRNIFQSADVPPGVTRHQVFHNQNQRPGFLSHGVYNGNPSSAHNLMSTLPKFRRHPQVVTNICIFMDPFVPGDFSETMPSNELRMLFEKLNQHNQVMPPAKPLIEAKVFIHHSQESKFQTQINLIPHYHVVNTFKAGSSPLIRVLPQHICDTTSYLSAVAMENFVRCILDINITAGGTYAIYLTCNCPEESPRGRIFTENDIKVMNIRQLSQFVDDIARS